MKFGRRKVEIQKWSGSSVVEARYELFKTLDKINHQINVYPLLNIY